MDPSTVAGTPPARGGHREVQVTGTGRQRSAWAGGQFRTVYAGAQT